MNKTSHDLQVEELLARIFDLEEDCRESGKAAADNFWRAKKAEARVADLLEFRNAAADEIKLYKDRVAELEDILGRCVEVIEFAYMNADSLPKELGQARAILGNARRG